ncbi:hypothetical protein [Chryseobacterium sp.]|uniref:hypothetical protein n=1 Tax=Chryseobacterium sp. TaxID=1871047 RepID=UPI00388F0BD8
MKVISKFLAFVMLLGIVASCVKKDEKTVSDLDKLRNSNNKSTYPAMQLDSAQVINDITRQKVQEVLELSTLYLSGNKNTVIDSTIYNQMKGYFHQPDSLTFKPLFKELESLKVKKVYVNNLKVSQEIKNSDTLDYANFSVEYFDSKNKSLGIFQRNAQYTLVSKPVQFKKEFKFYFVNFFQKSSPKDSTSVGVTR